MEDSYEPTPKDRKQMTNAELIAEYQKIGFTFHGCTNNRGALGLEVEVSEGAERYRIPTKTLNQGIAIQEALFALTNNVIIQKNQHWLQQCRTFHPEQSPTSHSRQPAQHSLLEKAYLCLCQGT